MDKYIWLQIIGLAPLMSRVARIIGAGGLSWLVEDLEDIFRTFPDWKMEIVDVVAEGDSVVVRCRVSGTHLGVAARAVNGGFLVGVQPTGKHFEVQHIHWYKVRDGMITDHSTSRDDLGMTQQLGLLPPH